MASLWAQLDQQNQNQAAPPPPSVFAAPEMTGPPPDMGAPTAPPIARMPTTGEQQIANTQGQLQKIHDTQARPWGFAGAAPSPEHPEGLAPNHNTKLGKVAHVFSQIGNIAGDIFAPDVMAHIPGTQMNREVKENELTKRLDQENTENELNQEREANTAKLNQDTAAAPGKNASEEALQGAQTEHLKGETAQGPSLANAYAHAVGEALKGNRDPAQDPVVQHLADAIQNIQKPAAEKGLQYQTAIGPDGKPHVFGLDPKGNKVADLGEHYERPISINTGNSELDHETARLAKPYEKGISDATTQLEKISDAKAMINGSAEAQALGLPKVLTALVSGQGSGVRITQAELNSIGKARGLSGDVEGTLNSWAGKGKLTATQQHQLSGILDDVQQRISAKQQIHSEALDRINGAGSREEAIKADKEARQKLTQPATETREYQGHSYQKGADGQWHLQQPKQ